MRGRVAAVACRRDDRRYRPVVTARPEIVLGVVARALAERVRAGDGVLVAVSGGPDSAALLAALARTAPTLGLRLEAASVDHGLRADAAADVAIAREQALRAGVPFHALALDVASSTEGGSVQARARDARYRALLALAAHRGLRWIAVGHTEDDQAETVLLRLLRGAGWRGLAAIDADREDGVIRPLLTIARRDVHAFVAREAWPVAHDPSNDDRRFGRVRVRSEVLPLLEGLDARVKEHLADLAEEARELRRLVEDRADELLGAGTPSVSLLAGLARPLRREVWRRWLEPSLPRALGRAHFDALDALVTSGHGEVVLPGGTRLGLHDGHWTRAEGGFASVDESAVKNDE